MTSMATTRQASSSPPVALGGLAALSAIAMGVLMIALAHHRAAHFNTDLLLSIHAHYAASAGRAAILASKVFAPAVMAIVSLLIALAAWLGRARIEAMAIAVVDILAAGTTEGLKHAVREARPHLFPWPVHASGFSFPSGHTMMATALLPLLALLFARTTRSSLVRGLVWAVAILGPLAIGFDRLYLGVHWPTDVLGGFLGGLVFACGGLMVMLPVQRRG